MERYILLPILVLISVLAMAQTPDTSTNTINIIPTIMLTEPELDDDRIIPEYSGILQSYKDPYMNTAGYTLGRARYRIRGYDNKNLSLLINGIRVNDAETGRPIFSNWGGLNDATRMKTDITGLGFSDYSFGGIMGSTNISTMASTYRKGTSLSISRSNTNYSNRIMATYASGLLKNGWAYIISISTRNALKAYVPGTFYEAYAYFFALEKHLNKKHSLNLTFFGSPSRSGRAGVSTMEAYKLSGSNFYNPNWGYQNGKIRNSRIAHYHQPRFMLTHVWKIDEKTKLTSTGSYMFGRGGTTSLNWYDAPNPFPDYYRNFPSYYSDNPEMLQYLTNKWENDIEFRQLDWDAFYFANKKNLFTVKNEGGIEGNDITGNRAKYILEERRYDINRFDFASIFDKQLSERGKFVGGVSYLINKIHAFKTVNDLLGADWWLDIDQFAERDFNDNYISQNNVDIPNKIVKKGDKFGYDYITNVNYTSAFGQVEYKFPKIDFFASLDLSNTMFWRTGLMKNGKFPEHSFGKSKKNIFFNYGIKAGATYKLSGHHFIILNAAYLTRAPYVRDAYMSPRTRDYVVNGLTSEKISSTDISYYYRTHRIKAKVTAFYSEFKDGSRSISFYHDQMRSFVNYLMTDITSLHYGGEIGIDAKVSTTTSITAVAGYGNYLYNNRPKVNIVSDNKSEILEKERIVYLKNYHIGGSPELAASLGAKYSDPRYWYIGVNTNYFAENFIQVNPEKHTQEALSKYVDSDPQVKNILAQEKAKPGYTIDIWGGKSWRIKYKYTLGFTLSITNILNNKNIISSGFEQYRFDNSRIDRFPNKYYYMYGRSYFINVYYRF